MVSARNSPCVESRKVQMGKPDRGDAFHTMWCCWAPISQDALAAAILSGCNQHSAHSHANCRNTEKILQRLSRGSFLRGCERNAGGFPWKASLLLRSSTSEWRAAAALKVPCPVSWLLFLSFFFSFFKSSYCLILSPPSTELSPVLTYENNHLYECDQ